MALANPVMIGHSDGGITGLHVAARRSTLLAGLVTIAAHGDVPRPEIMKNIYNLLTVEKWRSRFPDMVREYEALNPNPSPSKHRLGFTQDALTHTRCKSVSGHNINFPMEVVFQIVLDLHQVYQTELRLRLDIDEDIDITIRPRCLVHDRAEDRQ